MTTFSETSLPALIFTVPAGHPKGTVPALGRLTINEAQAVDQQWVVWGEETNDLYTFTDSTGSGALFYEAEARTLLNGSAVVTLSGSSGGGTNNAVESISLPAATDIPVWSTQASGGGAHLTHVGEFRVFARVQTTAAGTGSMTVSMTWGVGDLARYSTNDSTTFASDVAGSFRIVDLGYVTIPSALTGAQRWEGRIVANSSAGGDKLRIDCVWLVPTASSGEASASSQAPAASVLTIYDSFDQTAGALTSKVTPIGSATWTAQTGTDPDDWTVDATNHIATRTATSDSGTGGSGAFNVGRLLTAGTSNYVSFTASLNILWNITIMLPNGPIETGIAFRIQGTDVANYAKVMVNANISTSNQLRFHKVQSGVETGSSVALGNNFTNNTWYTLTVTVDATGRVRAWWNLRGQALGTPVIDTTDAVLATGGALQTGKLGIIDQNPTVTAHSRSIDGFTLFSAGSATNDAALFASQSLEVRHNGVVREDASGAVWQPVADYEGDLLRVPATSREGRQVRFIVKASRSVPGVGADAGIDDINATLAVTPRYLSVPAP